MRAALLVLTLILAPAAAASDFAYTQKVGAGDTVIVSLHASVLALRNSGPTGRTPQIDEAST